MRCSMKTEILFLIFILICSFAFGSNLNNLRLASLNNRNKYDPRQDEMVYGSLVDSFAKSDDSIFFSKWKSEIPDSNMILGMDTQQVELPTRLFKSKRLDNERINQLQESPFDEFMENFNKPDKPKILKKENENEKLISNETSQLQKSRQNHLNKLNKTSVNYIQTTMKSISANTTNDNNKESQEKKDTNEKRELKETVIEPDQAEPRPCSISVNKTHEPYGEETPKMRFESLLNIVFFTFITLILRLLINVTSNFTSNFIEKALRKLLRETSIFFILIAAYIFLYVIEVFDYVKTNLEFIFAGISLFAILWVLYGMIIIFACSNHANYWKGFDSVNHTFSNLF